LSTDTAPPPPERLVSPHCQPNPRGKVPDVVGDAATAIISDGNRVEPAESFMVAVSTTVPAREALGLQ